MTVFAYVLGSLALGVGTGLVAVALFCMEKGEREGYVTEGWTRDQRKRLMARPHGHGGTFNGGV